MVFSPCFFAFLRGGIFRDGIGPRLGNGIPLVSLLFDMTGHP